MFIGPTSLESGFGIGPISDYKNDEELVPPFECFYFDGRSIFTKINILRQPIENPETIRVGDQVVKGATGGKH